MKQLGKIEADAESRLIAAGVCGLCAESDEGLRQQERNDERQQIKREKGERNDGWRLKNEWQQSEIG